MQDRTSKLRAFALHTTEALCLAAMVDAALDIVRADGLRGAYSSSEPEGNSQSHHSLVRIPNVPHSYHRNVRIGLGKSVLF